MKFAETERLILRRPRPEDLQAYLRSWADPMMTRYTGIRPDIERFITALLEEMQSKQPGDTEPQPWYQVTIERRGDGAVVGDLGLGFGVPGDRQVELGYRIHPDHQRRGYGREAVAAAISWLIESHNIHRFVGVAAAENVASTTLLRSLDFRKEGHFRQSFLCNGEWIDDEYYALLASEWRERR
ncbi:MAG TPA: GNAT family protein [Allosphingosinicella sp.]|uniref:GNAT family N-acetyltransferase n=1 Tax=Allosphingosinicella sp. TaxID=2823234 RepID=UPI002ED89A3B